MIPSSIHICECLDGPYQGYIVRVATRRGLFQVKPMFGEYPLEWYELATVGGFIELRHRPTRRFG